jgi:hypothetical protein
MSATRGRAAKLRKREENVILLKVLAMMGRTPNWDAAERAKISLILNGHFGRYLMNFG